MSHVEKENFGNTKLCNSVAISDMTRVFLSDERIKIINNPGVLKMIQDSPRCKKKEEYCKRRKVGNMNGTRNTVNMNTDITQTYIA